MVCLQNGTALLKWLNAVFDDHDSWLMMAKPGGRLDAQAFGTHEAVT